jgi:hypothetical protein
VSTRSIAEARTVGGDDDVAHHRQLAAAAQCEACHRGDHRLAHLAHRLPVAGDEVAQVGVHVGLGRHRADVGAGREGLLVAGDDDAADAVVTVEAQHRGAQFLHQAVVQRVQLLRPVQRDHRGTAGAIAVDCGQDELRGHDTPLPKGRSL